MASMRNYREGYRLRDGGGNRGAITHGKGRRGRRVDISHTMSKIFRHKAIRGMRKGGLVDVIAFPNHPYMV